MKPIPVALVGLGRIASILDADPLREKPCTHAGAIKADPDCTLAAGADLDEERRRLFTERWHCPVYGDAETMIKTHSPAMLVIATHPDSHAHYCDLAAGYKIPVVICEKPLADTIQGARQIAELHQSGRIKILTNHERRYSADYINAKTILDEGRLGRLLSVKGTLYMGVARRILDVLWHDGTHLADAIMFLSGSVMKHQKNWGAKLNGRTGTAFLAGYLEKTPDLDAGGIKAIPFLIEIGAKRDHLVFEIECSCEQGRLRIGNGVFEVWESGPSPYAEGFKSLKKTQEAFEGPTGYFANMIRDGVLCIRNREQQPCSSASNGLRVIEYLNSVRTWNV
jgi:predicted dehydrogenase